MESESANAPATLARSERTPARLRDRLRWPALVRAEPLLFGFTGLAFIGYALYSVWEHNHFLTDFDLAIADQAVWHYSHLQAPTVTTIVPPVNILGDHFDPILIGLSPLYWVWSDPRVLLIAQAALIATSIVPVFLFAEPRLGRIGAYLLCGAYSVFWGISAGIGFQFHDLAFSPLLIALCVLFGDRRQWTAFFVSLGALLMVKENMAVLAVFIGFWLISGREFRIGAITIGVGVAWYLLAVQVLLPAFAGHDYTHWTYTELGPDAGSALKTVITDPLKPLGMLFDDSAKRHTLVLLFAPFLGLALCSRLAILCIPLIAQQLLSDFPGYWSPDFHHWLPIAAVLAMAAADGFRNVSGWLGIDRRRLLAGAVAGGLILTANLWLSARESPVSSGYDAQLGGVPILAPILPGLSLSPAEADRAPQEAIDAVPPDASVTAAAPVLPHLSQRDDLYLLGYEAPATDYVVFSPSAIYWPDPAYAQQWLDDHRAGYRTVLDEGGWSVWRKAG